MGLPDCGESAGFVLRHSGGNSSRRSQPPEKSRFEFLSNIEVPRRIFLIPTLSIIFAVLAGFAITALFKVFHQPISPAAVVQLHDHPALFAASSMLILLMMHVFDVRERIRTFAIRLMEISLLLIVVGLLLFNFLRFPSVVWVAPATIYYASSTRHSSFFRSLFKSSKGGFDPGFFSVSHLFRCHVHWAGDIDRDRRLHRGHLGHIARPNRHVQTAAEQTLPGALSSYLHRHRTGQRYAERLGKRSSQPQQLVSRRGRLAAGCEGFRHGFVWSKQAGPAVSVRVHDSAGSDVQHARPLFGVARHPKRNRRALARRPSA